MRLVVTARSGQLLEELVKACPGPVVPVALDLRMPGAARQLVGAALREFGQLDVLVNNAGATKRGDFLTLSEEDWADGFDLKFYGAVRCSREAWPHLVRSQGSIVNIVGIGGAVNAALLNLTKVLADRGGADGVRINAVNPGSIATDRQTRTL